ncbi:MAG: hypothetical protein V4629_03150 [Pseudomonadota bacterium]
MFRFLDNLLALALLIAWIAGVVIAQGFLKVIAVFIPFYSWYLVVEKYLINL